MNVLISKKIENKCERELKYDFHELTNNDKKQRDSLVDFVFVHDENDLMIIDEN